jgi:hypothetical protein
MTINTENVRAWVDALRSGAYQQGRLALRTPDDEFCCLGVACDVSGLGEWEPSEGLYTDLRYVIRDEHDEVVTRAGAYLPGPVRDWLGIESDNPKLGVEQVNSAVNANDMLGWTFDQIADAIEEAYLKPAA